MNTDDLELMNDFRALPDWDALTSEFAVSPVTIEAVSRAERGVHAAAQQAAPGIVRELVPGRRSHRLRWTAGAAVAAIAAAALVIGGPTLSTPAGGPVSVASAAEFLHHLAATVPPTTTIAADSAYWRVTFIGINPMNPAAGSNTPTTTTLWYGRTGGQWFQTGGGSIQHHEDGGPNVFALGHDGGLTWAEVTGLSSDPAVLEAFLRSRIPATGLITDAVEQLLSSAPLSAGQRSALFTILSRQPGISMRTKVEDASGRIGTAIDVPAGPIVTITLILADDGTLLQDSATFTGEPAPIPSDGPPHGPAQHKGDLLYRSTYLEAIGTDTTSGT